MKELLTALAFGAAAILAMARDEIAELSQKGRRRG